MALDGEMWSVVMYSAPARYQVHGALINIVLAKDAQHDSSLQGELFGKAETQHEGHYAERAALAFHKGIVSVDGYYALSHGKSVHGVRKELMMV